MLAEPQPTPLDLRFRLFGTPVSVHPFFWLMTVLLGWPLVNAPPLVGDNGIVRLLAWIAAVFVSILLHEFGHIWMGKAFGTNGYIVLHGMGGLAVGSNQLYVWWKRVLVSAAGPAIQFALWGAMVGALLAFPPEPGSIHPVLASFLSQMLYINLAWPILNLLPIWPLDGGQITRDVCDRVSSNKGVEVSLWISLIVCVVLALNAFFGDKAEWSIPYAPRGTYMGIFFAIFAVGSWQALQAERSRGRWVDDHREW